MFFEIIGVLAGVVMVLIERSRYWNRPELRMPRWLLTRSELHFQQWRLDHWHDTAASCGLRVMDVSSQTAPRLKIETRMGPVKVRIEEPLRKMSGIRIVAVLPAPPGPSEVRIRREKPGPPDGRKLETGDELFDNTFSIKGPARFLSALLDAEMRRLLLSTKTESRWEISRGEVRWETTDEELPDVLPLLLEISQRLDRCVDVLPRLAENARHDPEPGVRLRNLLLLADELAGAPEITGALRAACSDASPQVRLRAALELGTQGRDTLVELAESLVLGEGLVDDASAARAVSRLGQELPVERTQTILNGALRRRRIQTARSCLEELGKSEDPAAIDTLAKVIAVEQGELAVAAVQALGKIGSPATEPPLLQVLQREREDLQIPAAQALARAGTAAAVLPLQEVAEKGTAELRRAVRQAIAKIQSRLQGASPGQLSMTGAETGQLSVTPEPGQLSLAPSEPGQLSFPPKEREKV